MFCATHTEPAVIADVRYGILLDAARKMGAEHGRNAASWYFDGNTSDETYRAVLAGIDAGDPAILDTFPSGPLSGEWAGDMLPADVLDNLGTDPEDEWNDDLLNAYEDGFYDASSHAIERVARYMLAPEGPDPFDGI